MTYSYVRPCLRPSVTCVTLGHYRENRNGNGWRKLLNFFHDLHILPIQRAFPYVIKYSHFIENSSSTWNYVAWGSRIKFHKQHHSTSTCLFNNRDIKHEFQLLNTCMYAHVWQLIVHISYHAWGWIWLNLLELNYNFAEL